VGLVESIVEELATTMESIVTMKHPPRNPARALNNATTWNLLIWESDLPRNCKLVACYLRTHMNDYQEIAFPSVPRIASYCGLSENPIRDALKIMCSSGYLTEQGVSPKYGTNIYGISTPSESEPLQNLSNTPSESEPKLTNITNQVSLSSKFTPPSVEQLKEYQAEKGLTFDPDHFIDYWASVGWKRGRTPMKDWKATARNWARNENGQARQNGRGNTQGPEVITADQLLNQANDLYG